jgi:hypothetical protein
MERRRQADTKDFKSGIALCLCALVADFKYLWLFLCWVFIMMPGMGGCPKDIEIIPPTDFKTMDTPSDASGTLLLTWLRMPYDSPEIKYIIYRSESRDGPTTEVERIASDKNFASQMTQYFGFSRKNRNTHAYKVQPIWKMKTVGRRGADGTWQESQEQDYPVVTYFRIGVTDGKAVVMSPTVASGVPVANWFRRDRANGLIILVAMFLFLIYYISMAQRNPNMFLRKIPGIDAVDEAVGRATEMGKPILYSTGYYDITELSTICSVNILAHVAKKVAQYDSRLIVPSKWPVAMTVCQEVVREAYINAGRPDAFNPNDIYFIAGEQYSYTIGVDSIMVRERPAANFFLGTFAAEALILAETGASTGAIQISGTDSIYQIPFFVVACDYCLIGEELYAASAYLARNPRLVGSLKSQDAGKLLLFIAFIIGTIMVTLGAFYPESEIFQVIRNFLTVR